MNREIVKDSVVAVDITLERTTLAVIDVRGNILAKSEIPTGDSPNFADYAASLSSAILKLVEENGGYEKIRSVGICCLSSNYMTGCIENAANLPWKGVVPITAMLRDRLGLAVAIGNNAHARALGEHAYGAAHGMNNFVLITLSSGMGSCVFSNGMVMLGTSGFAGEIGHTCAVPGGRQCGCGNKGCLEMYTSSRGLLITAKELLAESSEPSPMRLVEQLTPQMVTAFCDQGDPLAREAVRRTGEMLGLGLANYASVVDPEAFIFTGKMPRLSEYLIDVAYDTFQKHVFGNTAGNVKFLLSNFNDSEVNLLGASVLAWQVKEYSLFR